MYLYNPHLWLARRKRNDSDEDIEKVLAELELEYSGQKKEVKDEPVEQKSEDEDKKKKGKKDKKKEKGDVIDIKEELKVSEYLEVNNIDDEMEVGTVKTAAQKKKEKKEREKQKKLAQKKAVCNSSCYIYNIVYIYIICIKYHELLHLN